MSLRSRIAPPVAAVALALGLATSGLGAPMLALASNGYVETETTTYTVNPDGQRLDVSIDIAFRNTRASTASTFYYFSGVYVWTEHGATNIRATADGSTASVRHVRRSGAFDQVVVDFPRLYYGQTRRVHLAYRLASGAPRSSSDIRVGRAIASFCVVGQGDDGGTTKVVIPEAYKVTITGGSSDELRPVASSGTSGAGTQTWSTGRIALAYDFWSCISATNPDGYATSVTTSPGGREIDLEAWPEDPQWRTEVAGELGPILTKLETLVGRELPGRGPIVMREVAGSELGNYAGFFNPETGVIVLGEQLGQGDVVAHELSHAWFNGQAFFSTWMSEGLAEWARISTVTDTCSAPGRYPDKAAAPNLTDWQFAGPRATTTDVAIVQWQYRAACYVVSSIAGKSDGHWHDVLKALFDNQLAYQAPGLVLVRPQIPVNWRQWLDAVDELGLAPAGLADLDYAQNLLVQYGISTDPTALANRSRARAHYHRLLSSLGAWTMPEAVLRPMSEWGFGVAESAMEQVEATLASVAKADAALPGIDAANGPVRMPFEKAKSVDDLKAAAALASDQAAAAAAVAATAARVAAPRDTVAEIGLSGADLEGPLAAATVAAKVGDLAGAQAALAQVTALLDGASQQGTLRIALAVGGVLALLLVLAFVAFRMRRRRRHGAVPVLSQIPPEVPPGTDP